MISKELNEIKRDIDFYLVETTQTFLSLDQPLMNNFAGLVTQVEHSLQMANDILTKLLEFNTPFLQDVEMLALDETITDNEVYLKRFPSYLKDAQELDKHTEYKNYSYDDFLNEEIISSDYDLTDAVDNMCNTLVILANLAAQLKTLKSNKRIQTSLTELPEIVYINQNKILNEFAKLSRKHITEIDSRTGTVELKYKDITCTIPGYNQLTRGFEVSTHQLFELILILFNLGQTINREIRFDLNLLMNVRNLKNKKELKKQVINDLQILKTASIQGLGKVNGKLTAYSFANMAEMGEIDRNGIIRFKFTETFVDLLKQCNPMYYPKGLLLCNSHKNPNARAFLYKATEHKWLNRGNKNEDIASVKTFLDVAPSIPDIEVVQNSDRAISRRIIEPFQRDMNSLKDYFTYEYCKPKGELYTDKELGSLTPTIIINGYIKLNWIFYPPLKEKKRLNSPQLKTKKSGKAQLKTKKR